MDKIVAWLMGGLGVLCILGGIGWQIYAVSDARNWPSVGAHVEAASIVRVRLGRSGGEGYEPRIDYRYRVNGRSYAGHTIWLDPLLGHPSRAFEQRQDAEAVLRAYPVGATVPVFHDPDNPERAILIIDDDSGGLFVALLAGLALMAIGYKIHRSQARTNRPPSAPAPDQHQ